MVRSDSALDSGVDASTIGKNLGDVHAHVAILELWANVGNVTIGVWIACGVRRTIGQLPEVGGRASGGESVTTVDLVDARGVITNVTVVVAVEVQCAVGPWGCFCARARTEVASGVHARIRACAVGRGVVAHGLSSTGNESARGSDTSVALVSEGRSATIPVLSVGGGRTSNAGVASVVQASVRQGSALYGVVVARTTWSGARRVGVVPLDASVAVLGLWAVSSNNTVTIGRVTGVVVASRLGH